jgi:excinuclease ABC subunit B
LSERRDVIVVATVSCIYGLGSPDMYRDMRVSRGPGHQTDPTKIRTKLVALQYERNDAVLKRGSFRIRGDVMEICPAYAEEAYRIEFDWDEVRSIKRFSPFRARFSRSRTRSSSTLRSTSSCPRTN